MGSVYNKLGGGKSAVLTTKSITANGTYDAASDNADGYSEVNVAIPLGTKSISANGTYNASSDSKAGYSQVTVNVNQSTEQKSITANGTYTPSSGKIGFSKVTVNVPSLHTISCTFNWRTTAGTLISTSLSGYSYVILKCRTKGYLDSYKKHVYICMPTNGEVVYGGWMCVHDQGSGSIYGNCAGTFYATTSGVYMDSFSNSDSRTAPYEALDFVALYGIK